MPVRASAAWAELFGRLRCRKPAGCSVLWVRVPVSRDTEVEDLQRRLAPLVLAAIPRRSGGLDAAEDAVQEALIAATRNWQAAAYRTTRVAASGRPLPGG